MGSKGWDEMEGGEREREREREEKRRSQRELRWLVSACLGIACVRVGRDT